MSNAKDTFRGYLKTARDSITAHEYRAALKTCKLALKLSKEEQMPDAQLFTLYLLVGVACVNAHAQGGPGIGSEILAEGEKSYREALKLQPDNPQAWQVCAGLRFFSSLSLFCVMDL